MEVGFPLLSLSLADVNRRTHPTGQRSVQLPRGCSDYIDRQEKILMSRSATGDGSIREAEYWINKC